MKHKRKYWKPKVGEWAEFALHPGDTRKLLRGWVFIRAKVYCGFLVTRLGDPNIWFALRHQLKKIHTKVTVKKERR